MFGIRNRKTFTADTGAGTGGSTVVTAAAPAAASTAAAPGGAGALATPSFAESLPEDIRGEASFRDIKDVGSLAKSYLNAQKLLGRDPKSLLALPGPDDAEGWNGVYASLGRPDAADKYVLPKPAQGDYSDADKAFQSQILPVLHEAGLTQRQLDAITPKWNALQQAMVASHTEAETAAMAKAAETLKGEWGGAYDQNLGLANAALTHYAETLKLGPDLVRELEATKLGNHPALAKLLAHLGKDLQEDGIVGKGGAGAGAALLAPAEARQQIAGLQGDKQFMAAYTSKSAPGHAEAVEKMRALYGQAYPGQG